MSTPMFTTEEVFPPPVREVALSMAIDFHAGADTDDPRTVIATAEEFLAFLRPAGQVRPITTPTSL